CSNDRSDSWYPAAIADLAAAECASRHNERSNDNDSLLRPRRSTNAPHHDGARRDGDVSLPAPVLADVHLRYYDAARARGHLRRDVAVALQPRQPLAHGVDGFYWFCCR